MIIKKLSRIKDLTANQNFAEISNKLLAKINHLLVKSLITARIFACPRSSHKNVCFFITHKTLNLDHAIKSLSSLQKQLDKGLKIDTLYIYNSNADELPNETLIDVIEKLNINNHIANVRLFRYDPRTPKSLTSDISEIRRYALRKYGFFDRVLLLKSDILISSKFFEDYTRFDSYKAIFYTPPFVMSKENVESEELQIYSDRDYFAPSDHITFFTESSDPAILSDFENPTIHKNPLNSKVKFLACTVVNDFSFHVVTIGLLPLVQIRERKWGGIWFSYLKRWSVQPKNSFFTSHVPFGKVYK